MFHRGKVWIIPNDDILQPLYFDEVNSGISHLKAFQEFADKFQLGMKFTNDDYQKAPMDIASCGHLVIKSDDDSKILIFYIPKNVTDRQLEFFSSNELEFNNKYSMIGSYSLEEDEVVTKKGILEIRKELTKKNMGVSIKK